MRTLRELKGEWRQIAGALDKLLRHAGDGDERKRA
jgi:hypothetical protein